MKISIITPSYNSELFLDCCIQSIKSQDYFNIEHIIVDGNSKDNTLKIISNYIDNIIYISEMDNGIYDAINKGIKLASGDIVGILNSDDFFADNNVVSRIVKSFNDNKIDAVFSDVVFVKREDINKNLRHYSSKFFKPWMFKFGFQPAHPTFYAKKELFENFGYYRTDLKIAGDFELLLRVILKNKINYKYIKDVWVKMRIGGVSTSGISSIIKLNSQIIEAHKNNNLYTNKLFVYSKYLVKWWGFMKK